MFRMTQERMIIITTEKIYNVKKNKAKRAIEIKTLDGVSKTLQSGKNEFAIHIKTAYDYRFVSERRDEIIDILKQRYIQLRMQNLKLYGIPKGDLK